MKLTKPLFLIGLRASGKTSLGKRLCSHVSLPLYDTDEMVQTKYQMNIANMVAQHGWQYFREKESEALQSIALAPCLVSTGGGIILDEENRNYMKENGFCVYLNPPLDSLVLRLMYNPLKSQRPSLKNDVSSNTYEEDNVESIGEEVRRTFLERDHLYKEIADLSIDTSKDMQSIVQKIMLSLT